jgi:hypothetical protein
MRRVAPRATSPEYLRTRVSFTRALFLLLLLLRDCESRLLLSPQGGFPVEGRHRLLV